MLAVEPAEQMRAVLAARLPAAQVVAGTAEATGLPAGCADAVVAGAAFHWFDRDRAFPEILRLLRAPGVLGLLGNGFDRSVPWVGAFGELVGPSRLGRPGHWPTPEELRAHFEAVDDCEFAHAQPTDRQRLLDLARSRSSVAALPVEERRELLERISALWDHEPELRGRESAVLPWMCRVRRCRGARS